LTKTKGPEKGTNLHCSFCGKSQKDARRLIAGPGVYICDECIEICNDILTEETEKEARPIETDEIPAPRTIKTFLDQYIIGQESAKRTLSVAVYNHYKRIRHKSAYDDVEIQKSNILLIGPTGCGKTLLAQTLAKVLQVPFAIADATCLTEAGYVGEDVENIILSLHQNADYDMERTKRGIIYIDEIDKISRKSDSPSITRDVSGEGVQQALLKIIEGTVAHVPPKGGRKHPQQEYLHIDTQDILFLCGGAFHGLEDIIAQRIGKKTMGFGADVTKRNERRISEILAEVQPEDLLKYGLIPEFIGRLPVVVTLHELDEDALIRILTEPKNSIVRQYEKLFEMEGVKLSITESALRSIAEQSIKRRSGARGLRAVLEKIMIDVMFELPDHKNVKELVISEEVIKGNEKPILLFERKVFSA